MSAAIAEKPKCQGMIVVCKQMHENTWVDALRKKTWALLAVLPLPAFLMLF